MKKILLITFILVSTAGRVNSQQCINGGCSNFVSPAYPSDTKTTTSSSWQVVSTGMNAGNYSLFSVTEGNTYEWSYCESDTGVPLTWDAQLTLYNESNIATSLCFVKDYCGLAPKINWKADFNGTVRLLTSANINGTGCQSNGHSAPYNKLVWRQSATGSSSLGTPALSAPANAASIDAGATINFSWSTVVGADSYDIEFDPGKTWAETVSRTTTSYSTVTNTSGEHSWHVRAKKGSTVGAWSSTRTYTVAALGTPTLSSPVNAASIDAGATINFSWSMVVGADSYDIEFDPGKAWAETVSRTTTSYSTLTNTSGEHSWHVRAKIGSTVGAWSSTRTYTVAALGTPTLSSPANAVSFDAGSTINFSWSTVVGADSYDIEFDPGKTWVETVSRTTTSYSTLTNTSGEHSWHVRAKKGSTVGTWSSTRTYTVAALGTPTLSTPANAASMDAGSTINFSWSTVVGAGSYDIEFDPGKTWAETVSRTTTSYNTLTNTSGEHSWHVRAKKGSNVGAWSSTRTYTVAALGTPTLSSPTNAASFDVGTTINFSWTSVANATYDIEFDSGQTWVYQTNAMTNSFSLMVNIASIGTHSWHIRSKIGTTVGAWSTSRSFTVKPTTSISTIKWSGFTWNVKNGEGKGPGPNNWMANSSNIWVDTNGNLHLKIVKVGEKWYCSEIYSLQSLGYGEYTFEVSSNVENFDKNIYLGLFTYEGDSKEIDLEFAREGNLSNPVGWYIAQPSSPESRKNFALNLSGDYSTHKFAWSPNSIFFQSFHGLSTDYPINQWNYTGPNNPPAGNERVHLNFWLKNGLAPSNNIETEVIIKSFKFKPIEPTITLAVPTGGEKWEIGEKKLIQWRSTYLTGRVNIEINGDYPNRGWDPLAMNVVNNGSYLYSVDGTEGSAKRIRISSVNNSNINCESGNLIFTNPSETITLISPKGGELWPIGSIQKIEWTTNNPFQNVNIEVNGNYPNGQWQIIKKDIPNDQIYFYTVSGTEGTAKRIRVSLTNKQAVKSESNNFSFTQPVATIKVLRPNGGEMWDIGTTQKIEWESKNYTGKVAIEVNGNFPYGKWEPVVENIENNGSFTYKVDGSIGVQKRIRVKSVTNPTISDISDANFSYFAPTKIPESIVGSLVNLANNLEVVNEIENSRLFKEYHSGNKIYGYISYLFGVKSFIDLADYYSAEWTITHPDKAGITAEGNKGWVTVWINKQFSKGWGMPVGMGITPPISYNDEMDMPDPKKDLSLSLISLNLPGIQITKFESNSDSNGDSWNILEQEPTTDWGFSVGEISINMYRLEIKKSTLDQLINTAFLKYVDEGELKTSNINRAIENLGTALYIIESNGSVNSNPNEEGEFRAFTSSDNNNTIYDGVIDFLRGGVDVDNDKYADNYYPIVPKTYKGLPLKENNTDLFFQNTGGNTADFVIKVINKTSDKWLVGSNDDFVGLTSDKRYDFPNVPVSKFYKKDLYTQYPTNWTIGCLYDAPDEAEITFELYYKRSLLEGKKALDTKTIKVKKLPRNGNTPPTINPIYPSDDIILSTNQNFTLNWSDNDPDDNALISIAVDPDAGMFSDTPWLAGNDNHIWVAKDISEDLDNNGGGITLSTNKLSIGTYSIWAVIYDGKNEPQYSKFRGNLSIFGANDEIPPYNKINTSKSIWYNKSNPNLDIDFFDNIGLNIASYQILSKNNQKSAGISAINLESFTLLEDNWQPLTTNGSTILSECISNPEDSLTTDWKISNSDWDNIIENNPDIGKHYIFLKVTDDAGNTNITPDVNSAFEFKIDIHSPEVTILNPTDGQNIQSNTVDFNWTADDLFNGILLSGIDAVFVALDQSEDFIQLENIVTNYIFKNLNDGVHTIYIKVRDVAGNFSELKHVNFSINSTIPLPDIITSNISAISLTGAFGGGIILDSKGIEIIEKGICWGSAINPTTSLPTKTNDGTGSGMFTSKITGLTDETTYHVRAYAINSAGTAYGEDISFTTMKEIAIDADFSVTPISDCTPLTVNFVDKSTGYPTAWAWDIDNDGITDYTDKNPTHTYKNAGTYSVKLSVTNELGHTSVKTSNIIINAQTLMPETPTVGIITNPTCNLPTGSVLIEGLPASGNWSLTRSPGGTITLGSGPSTTISGLIAGTYTYTVTNASGCTSLASANVVINPFASSPLAPTIGLITHPTCTLATGSVVINGLPATGTWTLTKSPGGETITGTGTSKTISGLAAGNYNYSVTNVTGCTSIPSANVIIKDQPLTPVAPIVGQITHPTCTLATGSVVLKGLPATGTWTITKTPGGSTTTGSGTSTTISGLATGISAFTVTNASGCTSGLSANVVINTQPTIPAGSSSNTATKISQTAFTASWNSSATATGYRLDVATNAGFTAFVAGYSDKDVGNVTSFDVTGLNANTPYYYRVRASNLCGASANSGTITVTTLPNPPAAPTVNPATYIIPTSFNANWNNTATATGYRLDVASDAGFTTFVAGLNDKDISNVTTYNVTGLSAHTPYYFRIRAYNSGGTGVSSTTINVTTLSNSPATPTGLVATSCNNLVTLKWRKNADPYFLRYRIYGGLENNPTVKIDSSSVSISDTSIVISGLTNSQTYYFRVKAVNNDGPESEFSIQSSAIVKTGVIPKIKVKWGTLLIAYNTDSLITNYQWYLGSNLIQNAIGQYYSAGKQAGIYGVETIDKNTCKNFSNTIAVTGVSTKSLTVYPNPASVSFALRLIDSSELKEVSDESTTVSVINSAGHKVLEFKARNTNDELLKAIPVSNLANGVYVVQVLVNQRDLYFTKIVILK